MILCEGSKTTSLRPVCASTLSEHFLGVWTGSECVDSDREDMRKCWKFLDATSRSFSAVIKELEGELGRVVSVCSLQSPWPSKALMEENKVCLFYLVLRALDTIEDDMTLPIEKKAPLLQDFYNKLDQDGWTFTECAYSSDKAESLS